MSSQVLEPPAPLRQSPLSQSSSSSSAAECTPSECHVIRRASQAAECQATTASARKRAGRRRPLIMSNNGPIAPPEAPNKRIMTVSIYIYSACIIQRVYTRVCV